MEQLVGLKFLTRQLPSLTHADWLWARLPTCSFNPSLIFRKLFPGCRIRQCKDGDRTGKAESRAAQSGQSFGRKGPTSKPDRVARRRAGRDEEQPAEPPRRDREPEGAVVEQGVASRPSFQSNDQRKPTFISNFGFLVWLVGWQESNRGPCKHHHLGAFH